jgi:hypothetical protein
MTQNQATRATEMKEETPQERNASPAYKTNDVVTITSPHSSWRSKQGMIVTYKATSRRYGVSIKGDVRYFTEANLKPSCPYGIKRNEELRESRKQHSECSNPLPTDSRDANDNKQRTRCRNHSAQPRTSAVTTTPNVSFHNVPDDDGNDTGTNTSLRTENQRRKQEIKDLHDTIHALIADIQSLSK